MKNFLMLIGVVVVALVGYQYLYNRPGSSDEGIDAAMESPSDSESDALAEVSIQPISHATMVLTWDGEVIYTDPVGGAVAFVGYDEPDMILVTDIHGDHLNLETLTAVTATRTTIVVPQAVADELTPDLLKQTLVLPNHESLQDDRFTITAIPMYNLPESDDSRHIKGRGNGYVIEHDGVRVYVAGDTADIPEMRSLTDVDIAFIPMNLPYTMSVEDAADAVLAFIPKRVYPYHYRTPEGFSDVTTFEALVHAGNPDIEVVLLDWYPAAGTDAS